MDYRIIEIPDDVIFPEAFGTDAIVGLSGDQTSNALVACDLDGTMLWRHGLEGSYRIGTVVDEECWAFGRRDLIAFAPDGTRRHEIEIQLHRREKIGAVVRRNDDLIVSIYRTKPDERSGMSPRVVRITSEGELLWSTMLPVDKIAYEGCAYMGVDTNWEVRPEPAWNPETWLPYEPDHLLISDNRLLASFSEMPRSGIGCRYVLDAGTGQFIWKSRATPIDSAIALRNGEFLIGDQGYGAYETHLYQDGQDSLTRWESHGHYVALHDGRLICVEMSNDMSQPQFLVELISDGHVERLSGRLGGYYSSKPVLTAENSLFFWRADRVWKWSDECGLLEVGALGFGEGSYASSLSFSSNRFGFLIQGGYENDKNDRTFAVFEV